MKFNRLGAFTLGVVITAASVGAVSFDNAAGNGTLKACSNKPNDVKRTGGHWGVRGCFSNGWSLLLSEEAFRIEKVI